MLVLTRRDGESVRIGDDIFVHVVTSQQGRAQLMIQAPDDVPIVRTELVGARAVCAGCRAPIDGSGDVYGPYCPRCGHDGPADTVLP